jgi:hypothetical protein
VRSWLSDHARIRSRSTSCYGVIHRGQQAARQRRLLRLLQLLQRLQLLQLLRLLRRFELLCVSIQLALQLHAPLHGERHLRSDGIRFCRGWQLCHRVPCINAAATAGGQRGCTCTRVRIEQRSRADDM